MGIWWVPLTYPILRTDLRVESISLLQRVLS